MATSVALMTFTAQGGASSSSGLDNFKTVIDIIGTLITGAAVVVGGVWAYFKFVKGRTFRPRLEVHMFGQWRRVDQRQLLHARIRVKNIGSSNVTLVQEGTGLRISVLGPNQPSPPALSSWDHQKVFVILQEHAWIEPGETVSDDLLLNLGTPDPVPTLFEARLVWGRSRGNVVFFAREIIRSSPRMRIRKRLRNGRRSRSRIRISRDDS
jgi:hypothetical protein